MTPEQKARIEIDKKLIASGWALQDMSEFNPAAAPGVAVREFRTDTGSVDYLLFVDRKPVGVVEAKKAEEGQNMTDHEAQTVRYAGSNIKWAVGNRTIRFAYEATGIITRFTDYADEKARSREVYSFHRPETLRELLADESTIRNRMKAIPLFVDIGDKNNSATAKSRRSEGLKSPLPKTVPVRSSKWRPARGKHTPLSPPCIGCLNMPKRSAFYSW